MQKKQIAVVVIVVAIMGYLYAMPIKGLVKPKETAGHNDSKSAEQSRPTIAVTVEMVSAAAKLAIGPNLSAQINGTETQLKDASDDDAKLSLQKKLAGEWDDV